MKLWKWHRKLRRDTGEVYMDRWQLLRTRLLSIYINRINLPDNDPLPHTHPWERSYSLKLKGGYVEHVYERASIVFERVTGGPWRHASDSLCTLARRPGRWSRIPEIHRINSLVDGKPCWTLFIGWKTGRPWGFVQTDGTIIPHQKRKADHGVTSED